MLGKTALPRPEPHDQERLYTGQEDPWHVLIHNDNETPFAYVLYMLSSVFMLSDELAEHVATTAHSSGSAIVAIRPRSEAEMLMRVALGRAKTDGHPLQFTMEKP